MSKKVWIGAAIIAVAIYIGMYFMPSDKSETQDDKATLLSVTIISPENKTLKETLSFTGITRAREEIQITTELSGVRVKELLADVGDKIVKGQNLAVLDGEALVNQRADLQSNYDRARDTYKRFNSIKDTGAVSQESIVQKRTEMESAKAQLDDADLNLKRGMLIAPNSGLIFERKAILGALVSSADPLFRIAKDSEIEISMQVPEAELAKIKIGQDANILLAGRSEGLPGTVRLISPNVDNASRVADLNISFADPVDVPVGIFAEIEVTLGDVSGVMVPPTAIQQDAKGTYVWQLSAENKASRLNVSVQKRMADFVIIEPIPSNTRIIARAGSFIKNGETVNIINGQKE